VGQTAILEKENINKNTEKNDENIKENPYNDKLLELGIALERLDNLNVQQKSGNHFLNWFIEVINKNIVIYNSKQSKFKEDHETYKKPKRKVYYIDFGKTIGSEFQNPHFAVVLYEMDYTALVIPITSKKDAPPSWVSNTNLIVDIGIIAGFPKESKECLAYIGGIQAVSKKRLNIYGTKTQKYDIELSEEQMNLIIDILHKNTPLYLCDIAN